MEDCRRKTLSTESNADPVCFTLQNNPRNPNLTSATTRKQEQKGITTAFNYSPANTHHRVLERFIRRTNFKGPRRHARFVSDSSIKEQPIQVRNKKRISIEEEKNRAEKSTPNMRKWGTMRSEIPPPTVAPYMLRDLKSWNSFPCCSSTKDE